MYLKYHITKCTTGTDSSIQKMVLLPTFGVIVCAHGWSACQVALIRCLSGYTCTEYQIVDDLIPLGNTRDTTVVAADTEKVNLI